MAAPSADDTEPPSRPPDKPHRGLFSPLMGSFESRYIFLFMESTDPSRR